MKKLLLANIVASLFVLTCSRSPHAASAEPVAADKATTIGAWGVDTASLSGTIRPGDDFYRYVNEGWLKSATIPAGLPAMDSFIEVYLSTEQRVGGIITEARKGNDATGTVEQQIADFSRSHADMARRNSLGITPIASTLSIISGTNDRADIARVMAYPWMDAHDRRRSCPR